MTRRLAACLRPIDVCVFPCLYNAESRFRWSLYSDGYRVVATMPILTTMLDSAIVTLCCGTRVCRRRPIDL
jgi:hypothetical protein